VSELVLPTQHRLLGYYRDRAKGSVNEFDSRDRVLQATETSVYTTTGLGRLDIVKTGIYTKPHTTTMEKTMTKTKAQLEKENLTAIALLEKNKQEFESLQNELESIKASKERPDLDYSLDDTVTVNGDVINVQLSQRLFKDSAIAESVGCLLYIEGSRVDGLQNIIDYSVSVPAVGKVILVASIRGKTLEKVLGTVTLDNFTIDRAIAAKLNEKWEAKAIKQLEKEVKKAWVAQYRVDEACKAASKAAKREASKRSNRDALADLF